MTLTKWFECGTDGRPTRPGWYEWELWLADNKGRLVIITTMAQYVPSLDFVLVGGRAIGITDDDHWRGQMMPDVELSGLSCDSSEGRARTTG